MEIFENVPLRPFVTLRAGGPAERFCRARTAAELIEAFRWATDKGFAITVLGSGSNVLPSDRGVVGLVIINKACRIEIADDGTIEAETGCLLQELFLKSAQAGLSGLEFAVGIPGTLGGALASNAGAYRRCISEHIVALEICDAEGVRAVPRDWMGFSYRHSRLREKDLPPFVVTRVRFKLPKGNPREIYQQAKEWQIQRIMKQPKLASAGSFFKNVYDKTLAESLPNLPEAMKEAGVVPAGFLIEACGFKGYYGDKVWVGSQHANFILNAKNAKASEIRSLVELIKARVRSRFNVSLEEEVIYIGRWS